MLSNSDVFSNGDGRQCLPVWAAGPPSSPVWALRSLPEADGITHELVSPVHPTVRWCGPMGWVEGPSDVSLSAIDLPTGGGWRRLPVTVQVEGGSYSLDGARQLRDVLNGFLVTAARDGDGPVG
jgi:hypothetical protein